ncbi:hypothetical protein [uncultured Propionibacterium sp.]|nr:hypothetical protein [uncultured Propionibacterium sp.]
MSGADTAVGSSYGRGAVPVVLRDGAPDRRASAFSDDEYNRGRCG